MHLKLVPAVMSQEEGWFEGTESDLKRMPIALSEDGWFEQERRTAATRPSNGRAATAQTGDRVLYRSGGELVPAVLAEKAVGGWWARDSRHGRSLFHLPAENIATRLPRPDLLGEAA